MPYADDDKRRRYQRERIRKRRAGALDFCMTAGDGIEAETVCPVPASVEVIRDPDVGTLEGVRQSLNVVVSRVLNDESLDPAIQGRTIASLCSVALRLVEIERSTPDASGDSGPVLRIETVPSPAWGDDTDTPDSPV